jgi:integrase
MGVYQRGESWYIDFYEDGKRYTERVGPVSKSVAEEKLSIRKSEVIRGEWKPKKIRVPFDKFKEQYLEYSKGNKKPGSSLRDECSLKHLIPFFGNKALSEITPFLIEKYKLVRKEEGAEPGTINRELGCLRHMFSMAMKWRRAPTNPVREVKFLKEPKGKDRILTEEEEVRLLEAVRTGHKAKHLEAIILTALHTGMRKGEILNLKWSNVDFKNGVITVEKTKNDEIRKIPMNKKLTETLEGAKKVSKGDYVFSENGKPYLDVKTGWWTALENAKIEGFRFHDLRHTFGSRLGMKGADIKTIQELMGHKDIKMTMRYSHPTPEHKKRAVKMLDEVTSIFTTQANPDVDKKVVSVGNR